MLVLNFNYIMFYIIVIILLFFLKIQNNLIKILKCGNLFYFYIEKNKYVYIIIMKKYIGNDDSIINL